MLDDAEIKAKRLEGQRWYEIDDIQDLDIAESIFTKDDDDVCHGQAAHQDRVILFRYNLDLRRVFGVVNTPVHNHAKPSNNVYSPLTNSWRNCIKKWDIGSRFARCESLPDHH